MRIAEITFRAWHANSSTGNVGSLRTARLAETVASRYVPSRRECLGHVCDACRDLAAERIMVQPKASGEKGHFGELGGNGSGEKISREHEPLKQVGERSQGRGDRA